MNFLTADLHFGHKNVIKYCNRPFKDVIEMNETIIKNWNSIVQPSDTVYILGDLSFYGKNKTEEILNRLNGELIWINGNHDGHYNDLKYNRIKIRKDYHELFVVNDKGEKEMSVLFHYPIEYWNRKHHGVPHFHGHVHGSLPINYKLRRIDVGIDTNNYFPYRYEDLVKMLEKYEMPTKDHHNNDL